MDWCQNKYHQNKYARVGDIRFGGFVHGFLGGSPELLDERDQTGIIILIAAEERREGNRCHRAWHQRTRHLLH